MTSRMLTLENVHAGYGHTEVLHGITLHVDAGELVALIGSNGAGKSTLLKVIIGLIRANSGETTFRGSSTKGLTPEKLIRSGLALVPEGRLLFGPMTVLENLELGAYSAGSKRAGAIRDGLRRVHELFPVLSDRADQRADTLSGGEQQMLAVGRALMSQPELLLLDEPSLGLAPKVIAEIFSVLDELRKEGMTILLVEQDARLALKRADRGYVMRTGHMVLEGAASDLLDDESVKTIYLGSLKGEGSS